MHVSNRDETSALGPGGVNRSGLNFVNGSNVPRHRIQTGFSTNPNLQKQIQTLRKEENKSVERFDFEVIACIVNAYQEWHYGEQAKDVLNRGL